MQWTRYLLIVLIGIVLPAASFCLAKLGLRYAFKVYHTPRETKTFIQLGLYFGLTTISTVVLMMRTETLRLSVFMVIGLLIMWMIACFDILTGRIPVFLMVAAFLLGLTFGLNNDRWLTSLMGGLANLALGSTLHWFGKRYAAIRFQKHPNYAGIGMGDAYGAGAMGALVGLSLAIFGFLIALILAVLYALPISMLEKRAITSMTVKLGPSFLLVTIVLFFYV